MTIAIVPQLQLLTCLTLAIKPHKSKSKVAPAAVELSRAEMTGILAAAALADAQKNARMLRVAVSGTTCAFGGTIVAAGMPLGWLRCACTRAANYLVAPMLV